ncbi:MAG: hypothetical protein QOH88_1281 [Verrucomicrobiota bacterium]|jgi:hypothetical protein
MKAIAVALLLSLATPLLAVAETTEIELPADPAVYGEFPKAYQEIITKWLETKLADAPSAQIVWVTTPVPGNLPGPGGKPLFGFLVEFKVNARNQFGTYTGMQKHRALIRNGAVIKGTGFGF